MLVGLMMLWEEGSALPERVDKAGRLRWREEVGFFTVYNYDTDDLFEVPAPAIAILGRADGSLAIPSIVDAVLTEFPELSADQVTAYIHELIDNGLLKLV